MRDANLPAAVRLRSAPSRNRPARRFPSRRGPFLGAAGSSFSDSDHEALSLGYAFTYAASGGSVSSTFRSPGDRRPFCIVRIKVFNSSVPGSGCRVGLLITRQPLGLTRSVEWSGKLWGSSVAAINHLFCVFLSPL